MPDYSLCGWHLRSDRHLPLLNTLPASNADPDISIRHGDIPQIASPSVFSSPFVTVYSNGQARINIGETLSMLVSDGRHVLISANKETPPEEIMTFLLGPALGLLCHQRQVLPLHAAAIKIGDKAVVLVGNSGAGKSTTATALVQRGHRLLCDDIAVINAQQISVLPSYPAIKLWQEAADALGIKTTTLDRTRSGLNKFHYRAEVDFDDKPTQLSALMILQPRTHITHTEIRRLDKLQALIQLRQHIYRRSLAAAQNSEQACFDQLGQIVSKVPVMILTRPDNFLDFAATLDHIEHSAAE
jgi:hypothetical protein